MKDEAHSAGYRIAETGLLKDILDGAEHQQVDLVMLDCTQVDSSLCEALNAFDQELCDTSRDVIISTDIDALDSVYSCFRLSNPHILVSTGRAERMLALSRVVIETRNARLRDFSTEDRQTFLLMSEQIAAMASTLDDLVRNKETGFSAFNFRSPGADYEGEQEEDSSQRLVRTARPPLPDPRLVRRIIRQRQLRARFFDSDLFADPAWDILLDLTAARVEHNRVSVTSLCIASGVPPTTALRWISQMVDVGLLDRIEDETDKRRVFIALSDKAADGMARYFAELGKDAGRAV